MSPTKLLALLLLALAVAARAEEPAAGVLTRAPAVVTPATPAYPEDAKARGVSGEVTLELDVSAEGEVVAARVTKPAGEGFDEAALAAARALRFSPAEIDGKPAAVTLEYRFRFDAPPPRRRRSRSRCSAASCSSAARASRSPASRSRPGTRRPRSRIARAASSSPASRPAR